MNVKVLSIKQMQKNVFWYNNNGSGAYYAADRCAITEAAEVLLLHC